MNDVGNESSTVARANGTPATPWARQTSTRQERATTRVRKMVEDLPTWEPFPPGESLVRRPSSS